MMNQNASTLTRFQGISYGLPMLSFAFLAAPSTSLLQGIYAKHFGLSLTTIATVLLIVRLFDAVTDPIIGYCSDRYYARYRSHRPFIIVGVLLFIISTWFLYVPFDFDPEHGQTSVGTGYFLIWFLAFYLTQTIFEIPHMAWGSGLANDSKEKNTVYGLRSFFAFVGGLLFFSMPLLPWFETTEFTPQTLKWSVLVAGSLMLATLYISMKFTPNNPTPTPLRDTKKAYPNETPSRVLRSVFSNRPFLVLTAAHICTGFGAGMWYSLLYIFVDTYLNLGLQFAQAFVIASCLKIASLRLWFLMANYWGKQITWVVGMILVVLGALGTGLLSPGSGWVELLVCMALVFCGFAAFTILVPSLLSDIVDYGTWKFGQDRAATHFSVYCFINKAIAALGGALALAITGWFGFDPTSTSHSDTSITGLQLSMVWIPILFISLSIVFISRIPITAHRHAIIRRRQYGQRSRTAEKVPARHTTSVISYQPGKLDNTNPTLQT